MNRHTFKIFLENFKELPKYVKRYVNGDIYASADIAHNFDELLSDFSNDRDLTLYRGLNFDNEEDYKSFIDKIKNNNNYINIDSVSSFSIDKKIAESFSVGKPIDIEGLSKEELKDFSSKAGNNNYVNGHIGIIISVKIKKGQGLDISNQGEKEVILYKTKLKVISIEEIKTNDSLIKESGLSTILNKLEPNDKRFKSLLRLAVTKYKDDLTISDKTILGKYFLSHDTLINDVDFLPNGTFSNRGTKTILANFYDPNFKNYLDLVDILNKNDLNSYLQFIKNEFKIFIHKIEKQLDEHDDIKILHLADTPNPRRFFKLIDEQLYKRFLSITKGLTIENYGKSHTEDDIESEDERNNLIKKEKLYRSVYGDETFDKKLKMIDKYKH